MPEAISDNDKIKWIVTGKSELGQRRKAWWLEKKNEFIKKGIFLFNNAPLSPTCLVNHPTKEKPCQTCGKIMKLEYVYPTKNTLKKIENLFNFSAPSSFLDIFEILGLINFEYIKKKINRVFSKIDTFNSLQELENQIKQNYVNVFSRLLSPGAMSNCPDRLDGFHSYNKCCREKEDLGRNVENLKRYGEDRRAYEYWSDGDWKAASWLMKKFNQHGLSPDHIGPISLGFCHRPKFQPLSKSQNSSKGNRLSYKDFKILLYDEKNNEKVVSWHSRPLWDKLKLKVKCDKSALKLGKFMRVNMDFILNTFFLLKKENFTTFLKSLLNPEYAFYSIEFTNFNPQNGSYDEIKKKYGNKTQYHRNSERYVRIALESLDSYANKINRKITRKHLLLEKAIIEFKKNPSKDILTNIFEEYARSLEQDF